VWDFRVLSKMFLCSPKDIRIISQIPLTQWLIVSSDNYSNSPLGINQMMVGTPVSKEELCTI
jgi:hypothetical protein